ncbi:hypothetical protein [Legionella cincinnatiensis]|uniref:hypothetical protein n=1 Tax=Legionella cincinnatiensis TaxID=28085 RepID=UPI001F5F57B7|nr:hypothetical protein [Legionella cincinnatiensis]
MEKRSIRHTTMLAACLGCFSCLVSTFIFADPSSQVVRLSYLNGTLSFLSFKERQQILLKNGSNPWSPLQSYKMATKKNFNDVFQKVEPKNKKSINDVFQKVEPKNKKSINDIFQKVESDNPI